MWLGIALAAVAGLMLVLCGSPTPVVQPVERPVIDATRPVPVPVAEPDAEALPEVDPGFDGVVAGVREACGLEMTVLCRDGACVASNRLSLGWMNKDLWWNHPRMALEAQAFRVGISPLDLPCGAALAELHRFEWLHAEADRPKWGVHHTCWGYVEGCDGCDWVDRAKVLMPLCAEVRGIAFVEPDDWEPYR